MFNEFFENWVITEVYSFRRGLNAWKQKERRKMRRRMALGCAVMSLALSGCAGVDRQPMSGIPFVTTEKFSTVEARSERQGFSLDHKFRSIQEVNEYVNAFPYVAEKSDKWLTPAEFVKRGGDCEDYALTKRWLIRKNHLADGQPMDILLVFDIVSQQHHAVLVVGDRVLDNQSAKIEKLASLVWRYRPLAVVNGGKA